MSKKPGTWLQRKHRPRLGSRRPTVKAVRRGFSGSGSRKQRALKESVLRKRLLKKLVVKNVRSQQTRSQEVCFQQESSEEMSS